MCGCSGKAREDSPLGNRGREDVPKQSFLESLSDEGLVEYIGGLSQGQPEAGRQNEEGYSRDDYFHDKQRRQERQDQEFRDRYGNGQDVFCGVSIYVNGFTRPGRMQLHEMVVANGGKFVHFLSSKRQVTHIVASNLPLKKRVELAGYRICRPEWVVDSVKAGRLLRWQEYGLLSTGDEMQSRLPLDEIVSCKHPDFLKQFFSKSRLHHLSNWKADLRAEFCGRFLDRPLEVPVKGEEISVLHVDFDCFFASVAALVNGYDVCRDAVVVCHGTKNSDIASCNYVARQYGIRNGMWVGAAQRQMPAGVELIRLGYDFEAFENMSKRFYEVLHEWGFQLVLPVSIDEAVCIVGRGMSEYESGEICEGIRRKVGEMTNGCSVSIGCGESLVLARLALKIAKPDGYKIIVGCGDEKFWSMLKVDDLPGVGKSIVLKLNEIGDNRSLLQVRQLPLELLQRCVGEKMGTKMYLAVRGKDDEESLKMVYEPREFFQRKSLSVDINWGIRFDKIQEIDQFIDRCTEYLTEKLKEIGKKTSQVTLKVMKRSEDESIEPPKYLGMGRCDPLSRSARLGVPTDEGGIISTEIKSSFRTLGCPPRELRGIAIQFNKLGDSNSKQSKLPFVDVKVYQNLPNDVKGEIGDELKKRRISIKNSSARASRINSYQAQFIQELPTQIRHEVQNEILINDKVRRTKFDEMKEQIAKRDFEKTNEKSHFLGSNSILIPIKFQNQTNFKKIVGLVLNWVDGTLRSDGPHERDLRLFEKYLQRLSDANRLPLALRISKLISTRLELRAESFSHCNGFQEWERVLLQLILPKLNKNKHTFQTVRKLDIDFDT